MKIKLANQIREEFRISSRDEKKKVHIRTEKPQVNCLRVHSAVWAKAMQLADGDALRICVKSPTEVVVFNNRQWRNGR